MGFRISWMATQQPVDVVLPLLDATATGESGDIADFDLSIGVLPSGWTLVWAEDESFFDTPSADMVQGLSPVLTCWVNETIMHMRVRYYDKGELVWQAWHEGDEVPTHIAGEGALPSDFAVLVEAARAAQAADREVDYLSDVPLDMAEHICGFKHDSYCDNVSFQEIRLNASAASGKGESRGFLSRLFGKGG